MFKRLQAEISSTERESPLENNKELKGDFETFKRIFFRTFGTFEKSESSNDQILAKTLEELSRSLTSAEEWAEAVGDKDLLENMKIVFNYYKKEDAEYNIWEEDLIKFLKSKEINFISRFSTDVYKNYPLDENDNLLIIDLSAALKRVALWAKHLPSFKVFYAIKCCPDEMIIALLAYLGCSFDCASKAEVETVMKYDVDSSRIIYANPIKDPKFIQFAGKHKLKMTFDSSEELKKIAKNYPGAELVLRIKTDDSHSVLRFSTKFGCSMHQAKEFLALAQELGLKIVGVSFHVGSKCRDPISYDKAIEDAKKIFDMGKDYGMDMYLLDIGGGFPGTYEREYVSFEDMAKAIDQSVKKYFDGHKNMELISEPGRFIAMKTHTLYFTVIGKKENIDENGDKTFIYYMNDGVYGSFNCILYDQQLPAVKSLKTSSQKYKSIVFGPTCDSMDKIASDAELPELEIGDICYVEEFGAYTKAAATCFNGFQLVPSYYTFPDV